MEPTTGNKVMRDSLTGDIIKDGAYKACIIYLDEKTGSYREAFFSRKGSLMIWLSWLPADVVALKRCGRCSIEFPQENLDAEGWCPDCRKERQDAKV